MPEGRSWSDQEVRAIIADNERLRSIETAARRFVGEANSHPRYITVRTWATAEADPYLNLKSALAETR